MYGFGAGYTGYAAGRPGYGGVCCPPHCTPIVAPVAPVGVGCGVGIIAIAILILIALGVIF